MGYSKKEIELNNKLADREATVEDLNELLSKRNSEIAELKKRNVSLESELLTNVSDEDLIKKILSLYAKNKSHLEIYEALKYKGYRDTTLDFIKELCDNREELESKFVLYFKEEEKAYVEQLKIDSNILKDKLVSRYERLYSSAEYDLSVAQNEEEKRKLREEMNKHLDKLNNVLKNVVEDDKEKSGDHRQEVNKVMENHSKNKIVSFKAVKRKVADE